MKLEKLTIKVLAEKGHTGQSEKDIEVLFNPNEITIEKTGWNNGDGVKPPKAVNTPATLSLNLFFDTSLPEPVVSPERSLALGLVGKSMVLQGLDRPEDVRRYTNPIVKLMKPRGKLGDIPAPKECMLIWGRTSEPFFHGVLRSVSQTFSRFLEDGTPVRATLRCSFEEYENPEYKQKEQNQIDDPIRIVRRGETLSSIAAEEYGNPSLWRVIAIANQMDNPRQLVAGQRLTVPPLRSNNAPQRK